MGKGSDMSTSFSDPVSQATVETRSVETEVMIDSEVNEEPTLIAKEVPSISVDTSELKPAATGRVSTTTSSKSSYPFTTATPAVLAVTSLFSSKQSTIDSLNPSETGSDLKKDETKESQLKPSINVRLVPPGRIIYLYEDCGNTILYLLITTWYQLVFIE
jgi:hypothetical protein